MNWRHSLLQRQVRQHLGPDTPVPAACEPLLRAVEEAYENFEAERRRAEEAALKDRAELNTQQARHLEALGGLAGGIAHEFNNLLTIVMSNASLAMLDSTAMATVGDCLRDIQGGASRARDLTQQLITFAKAGNPLRVPVSLSGLVRAAAESVLAGSAARGEFEFAPDLWPASVDREQMTQALQNLVLHAAQSTPPGGKVRIALGNEPVGSVAPAGLRPGRYLRLSVSDAGPVLSPDARARIFEPHFSTKRPGNGLGLAAAYAIVKRHEGHIEVDSAPGRGTTFSLWLAAAETATATSAPFSASRHPLNFGCGARVLVMDDEGTILRVTAALLKRMGLEATVVSNGDDAVRAFAEARDAGRPFGLLIFDLTIPGGMGGQAAIEIIRQTDTEVPAIVSSGYLNHPVMADFASHGFQAMITKPYVVNDLARTVQHVLARSSQDRLAATG